MLNSWFKKIFLFSSLFMDGKPHSKDSSFLPICASGALFLAAAAAAVVGEPTHGNSLTAGTFTYSWEVGAPPPPGPRRGSVTFVELQLPELMLKGSCCLFSAFSMTQDWRLGDRDGILV